MSNFCGQGYWDDLYKLQHGSPFEWYTMPYSALQPLMLKYLPCCGSILHVGVGTSTLQNDMADDGYVDIINVDYSPVVIAQQVRSLHKQDATCTCGVRHVVDKVG